MPSPQFKFSRNDCTCGTSGTAIPGCSLCSFELRRFPDGIPGSAALLETADRFPFVRVHFKYREQLRDLQQVLHLFRQIQQLQFPLPATHCRKSTHQFANPRTVDVVDVSQIKNDSGVSIFQQVPDCLPEQCTTFSQGNPSAEIHHLDFADFARCCDQCCHEPSYAS